jgi:predicted phosphate transport protein (TIGR00153 family)
MRFFKKEKEVVELVLRHLEITERCLSTAAMTVDAYLRGVMDEAKGLARQVGRLESEADLVRYEIRDKLYSGAYLPLLREDIYRLVESIDKLANAGEACCDFFLNQRPSIPEGLAGPFLKVSEESLGIIRALRTAVQCFFSGECRSEVVREHTKEIDQIESRVDKLEWDLTKSIFTASLDHSQKIHLKLCLNSIVEISDRAEDASDQLDLATLKSSI